MVSVDYVIQGVKSRAKFIDMSPGAQRLLLSEIDRFFNTHLCRVLPTGSYNWLVEVHHPEWKSYGTISEGAYQAILEECIERVASREWKKVSDRLLLRNNSAVGVVASVLDHEQEHDDDIEQQARRDARIRSSEVTVVSSVVRGLRPIPRAGIKRRRTQAVGRLGVRHQVGRQLSCRRMRGPINMKCLAKYSGHPGHPCVTSLCDIARHPRTSTDIARHPRIHKALPTSRARTPAG